LISLDDRKVWLSGVRHLKKQDPKLRLLIEKVGKLDFDRDGDEGHYEFLVASIVYQQIAGNAARAILARFKGLYNGNYPTPRQYLKTKKSALRAAGLSPQKISYILDLSRRIVAGRLDLEELSGEEDEKIIEKLDEVRGIGRWTAEMFLMFSLRRVDVLPFDDLGVQKAIKKFYRLRKLPSKEKMERLRAAWQPYGSIATLYLWRALAAKKEARDKGSG
jgi:DNA-3-methyladenine glycosylase II